MKVFIRTRRLLHLATFVLLAALIAVWLSGLGGHALAASTWTSQTSPTIQNLNGIACPGTTTCFAVGALASPGNGNGTIVVTTDGSTWTSQNSKVAQILNGIACPTTSTCFAVGASGTILKTTNGGSGGSTPWAQLTSGTS